MRTLLAMCLLVGLLAVPLRAEEEKAVKTEASVEHEGVRLHAKVTAPCVAGRAIQVAMSLSNNSKKKIAFGHITYYYNFDLQMTDAMGKAVPLTRFGQSKIGGDGGQFGMIFKYSRRELAPGASYRIELNLNRLFDLSVAGTYTLRIRRRVDEGPGGEFVLDIKDFNIVVAEDEPKVETNPQDKAEAKE